VENKIINGNNFQVVTPSYLGLKRAESSMITRKRRVNSPNYAKADSDSPNSVPLKASDSLLGPKIWTPSLPDLVSMSAILLLIDILISMCF
jgi:hypothetical protein